LHVQKQLLDAESMMFCAADLDTVLVLPKIFGSDAKRVSENPDVAQEECLQSLSIEMGHTGNDMAETESFAAKSPLTPMAVSTHSTPMTATETVKCMGVEDEPLHIVPDSTSSLHMTRDKVRNEYDMHTMRQSSFDILSPASLLQNMVQINGAGHISLDEEIKQAGQLTTHTGHISNVAATQVTATQVTTLFKSQENDADINKHIHSGMSHAISDLAPKNSNVTVEVTNNMLVSVSSKPSVEEVIAFGGIPCPHANEVRISKRIGAHSDADLTQMERAMKNTQMRNSVNSGNHVPKFSILSIPDIEIKERADRMGISLGKSFDEVASSINGIKNREGERTLLILKKNADEISNEGPASLIVSKASNLCEDLIDDEEIHANLVDHVKQPTPINKEKKKRRKKVYDLSNVRKSTRKIIKKQYS
jgi:hypothetical protein